MRFILDIPWQQAFSISSEPWNYFPVNRNIQFPDSLLK